MSIVLSNVMLVLRALRQRPMFAATVALTLAIGIGATTAAFTLVKAVLLTPLPVRDQDRLVVLTAAPPAKWAGSGIRWSVPWEIHRTLNLQSTPFVGTAAFQANEPYAFAARYRDRIVHVGKTAVSGTFFNVLGVRPSLGRLIRPEDDVAGSASVAVLSESLWRREFGADPHVLGRMLFFAQTWHRIIGVAAAEFSYPAGTLSLTFSRSPGCSGLPVASWASVSRSRWFAQRSRWPRAISR